MIQAREKIEFGDFQTPPELARLVVSSVGNIENYTYVVEPTCGEGNFLQACLDTGVGIERLTGWEINPEYVSRANNLLCCPMDAPVVKEQDIFSVNWQEQKLRYAADSVLFIGNPPWVTNAQLGALLSRNLPAKSNFKGLGGMAAMTGSSNFDVSEWILIKLLEVISGTNSAVVFIVKTSVARNVFQYVAKNKLAVSDLRIVNVDASKYFSVSVDACVFSAKGCIQLPSDYFCRVYVSLDSTMPLQTIGCHKGNIISDINVYKKYSELDSKCEFVWRSGIKHDASMVMEFSLVDGELVNMQGEKMQWHDDYVYPMYKSSHIAREELAVPSKFMLVTQKKIGDSTEMISEYAPAVWQYLLDHASRLDSRKSSIYRNSPRFSVFGVGDYSFSNWKVVVSGLYKNIRFQKIGTYNGKPIVLDDTCYLLAFDSEEKADFVLNILNSELCMEYISSLIFLDSKRPVTVALLNRINIRAIAIRLGLLSDYDRLFTKQMEFDFSHV